MSRSQSNIAPLLGVSALAAGSTISSPPAQAVASNRQENIIPIHHGLCIVHFSDHEAPTSSK